MHRRANRLAGETSPYLLQHAHNPVDWYPWGEEALRSARDLNRPILLSIGYSACHWCHVMEHESFEDDRIAGLMNENFINIKVDREERPDLDELYMRAVQLMTGHGGWPLTVFLTPEGVPFFGGTYFPPEDRYQIPGFRRILQSVSDAYRRNPEEVVRTTAQVMERLKTMSIPQPGRSIPGTEALEAAARKLTGIYDAQYGGLGQAPKFPHPDALAFLLRAYGASGSQRYLEAVTHSLRMMANGGIYDHLGGGFHRYSTDERWLVPHFEKMLYDNAQLPRIYLQAFQITGDRFFLGVAMDSIAYLLREMRHPEGGFYSTQDADSEGEEGKFFVWTPGEIEALLGAEDAPVFCRYYGVTEVGNFEAASILHATLTTEQLAKLHRLPVERVNEIIQAGRKKLMETRSKRVPPGRDDKIILAWNGLTLSLLADAHRLTDDKPLREVAERLVDFVDRRLRMEGGLGHSFKDGEVKIPGFLDDYAFWAEGLLDLYEATLETRFLDEARSVAECALREFSDPDGGAFFFGSAAHDTPLMRTKPTYDGAVPSGNSVLAHVLLRLHHYFGDPRFLDSAESCLAALWAGPEQHPLGCSRLLSALDFHLRKPVEIFLVPSSPGGRAEPLLRIIQETFLPNRTVRILDGTGREAPDIMQGKKAVDGKPTVYVCRNFTCSLPVTEPNELKRTLRRDQDALTAENAEERRG